MNLLSITKNDKFIEWGIDIESLEDTLNFNEKLQCWEFTIIYITDAGGIRTYQYKWFGESDILEREWIE